LKFRELQDAESFDPAALQRLENNYLITFSKSAVLIGMVLAFPFQVELQLPQQVRSWETNSALPAIGLSAD